MKKVIPIILALLLFSGCKAEKYTPVINVDFKVSAVVKTGDFSYSCNIERAGDTVYVSPTSSRAKGLVISCSSKEVSFKRKTFSKTFPVEEIDKTNPAVILHRVFTSLESADIKLIDGAFIYSGNCELGKYILTQNKDNSLKSLSVPQAHIEFEFTS